MAFLSKVGNILRQSANKKIGSDILDSRLSICQAVRWMSYMSNPKLFVGGLSYNTDEQSLREAFAKYGEVSEARIIIDRETGRSRGFGFVSFNSSEEASSAIQALDGQDLHGRQIKVNYANDRARGGGGGYGDGGHGGGGGYGDGGHGGGGYSGGGGGYSGGGGGYSGGGGGYSGVGGGYSGGVGGYSGGGGGYSGSGGGYSGGGGNSGTGYGSGGNYASNFGSDIQGIGGNYANNIGGDSPGSFSGNEAGGYNAGSNFAGGSGSGYGASSGLGYPGGDQFGSNENTINSAGDQNLDGTYQNNDDTHDFAKRA